MPNALNELQIQIKTLKAFTGKQLKQAPLTPFATLHPQAMEATGLASTPPPLIIGTHTSILQPLSIDILGAGTSGLLAATLLAKAGHRIRLYEKRSRDKAALRYPNISFKEAESRLKPLLGNTIYQQFFQRGGSLDGNTGKLRVSIGAFQEVLLEALDTFDNVDYHFDSEIDFESFCAQASSDCIILATGTHSHELFDLAETLDMHYFPEFTAHGRTALYINASHAPHGYSRFEREGYNWRRDNVSIYSGDILGPDLRRVSRQLPSDSPHQALLQRLQQATNVEYSFSFGNDTAHFLEDPTNPHPPILTANYEVSPMIALNPVFERNTIPVIALGDANGTPHPLAAIGTLKFLRNMQALMDYMATLARLKTEPASGNYSIAIRKQQVKARETYCKFAMQNIFEVFYGNILSSLFSLPRL